MESIKIPFQGVNHARAVPESASYFSREPRFNDMYLRITKLLMKYHHLPTLLPGDAPQLPWSKLDVMRAELGEPIKASHYAKVMRVAKRLNLIETSLRPTEVTLALGEFTRKVDPSLNIPAPITIDKYGRAVGVGKRKASTARAFVVEGTGEVLINGKPLNKAFGRVHDRESALWALTATQRLDKYNVWALVEGGGTTGQAEALTLAVAKALVAHEPALKTALRRGKCILISRFTYTYRKLIVITQPDVSRGTQERWKGSITVVSRLARARPGSSDKGFGVSPVWNAPNHVYAAREEYEGASISKSLPFESHQYCTTTKPLCISRPCRNWIHLDSPVSGPSDRPVCDTAYEKKEGIFMTCMNCP
jgi:small subunit ribosomal protein S9